ncbi:replicative DNA helicase [Paucilactobacillus nenjiangensis]|uniref:Replicative DNA helicase n=1 Tax=Paucilactobacillus nenjiangensis TaxID=1296540 RepID=A0A5P1WXX5_9LACO|nr:replicative DNA helicase [Paucilactobacillus nenjiangensis]QER66416.1 replicative DNA helicase [Paucilactobacillus nenjiangensis]
MNNDVLIDQTQPQNIEAEKAVLGAIFLSNDALVESMEYLTADDFFKRAHQITFEKMVDLNDRDKPIDVLTIREELEKANQVDDIGGVSYIVELAETVPTAANVVYYAKIVQEKSVLRKLIKTATTIVTRSYVGEEEVSDLLDEAERSIMNVSEATNKEGFKNIRDVLSDNLKELNRLATDDSEVTGLSTGFTELDKMTTGLHDDELIILAARPAVGKTAFALNIAQNVGTQNDTPVAIFSLEMSAQSLVSRMLCAEGSIDANHFRTGNLTPQEWDNLMVAMGSLSKTKIFLDDTAGIKVAEIRAKCRRLAKEQGGIGLIVIDYLQLIEGTNHENRQQEVSDISRQLKKLAKELHVPVIALSQLSRGVEQRQDKRPVLSDIRESGSIEQDADIVGFLYREDYYERDNDAEDSNQDPRDNDENVGEVEVIIEKNRSGARGTVRLLFVKSYNKFSSIAYMPDGH